MTCSSALGAIHIFTSSWANNQVKWVIAGREVPDSVWAETVKVTGNYHVGMKDARSNLKEQDIPESFVVYRDLADADAVISDAVAAARARDDSRVISIYARARTAEDHIVESCDVLSDKATS